MRYLVGILLALSLAACEGRARFESRPAGAEASSSPCPEPEKCPECDSPQKLWSDTITIVALLVFGAVAMNGWPWQRRK